jgi:hypothetical protein
MVFRWIGCDLLRLMNAAALRSGRDDPDIPSDELIGNLQ